jgi:hypothetical protein
MKKLALAGLMSVGLALGAFGQGAITPSNGDSSSGGLSIDSAGNFYSGTLGFEVLYRNGSNVPTLDTVNTAAYDSLAGLGFTSAATYSTTITAANQGVFSFPSLNIAGISPAGSTATFAFAAWNTTDATWAAMVKNQTSATRAGVVVFSNTTGDYTSTPTPGLPATIVNMPELIMTPLVPEPTTLALAGLGAAALLVFRRRK